MWTRLGHMRGRKKDVTDEEILMVIRTGDDPVYTTFEIAEEIGLETDSTRPRLESLLEEDKIQRKESKKPKNSHVWWIPENFKPTLEVQKIGRWRLEIDRSIRELQLPGADLILELRQIAVQIAYDYVGVHSERSFEEVVEYVYEHNPAGFRFQRTALEDLLLKSMESLDTVQIEESEKHLILSREN